MSIQLASGCGTSVRIANTYEDRVSAFQLIHRKYVESDLIEPNEHALRVTPYHLLPTTTVFMATEEGRTICTVSLIGDGELGLPMESIYAEEIRDLRSRGLYVGEVSCLAFDAMPTAKFMGLFTQLTRLMAQHARQKGMDQFVIAVHPHHLQFYKRLMGFEQIGPLRDYPSVQNAPAVACALDFEAIDRARPKCWTSFFGVRLSDDAIRADTLSNEEVDTFAPIAQLSGIEVGCLAMA